MTAVLYGIKNCDTVKKARLWLEQHRIEYRFHDFRGDGLDAAQAGEWLRELGADTLINRRGTTWRQLDEKTRADIDGAKDIDSVAAALVAQPTLIKRPVLDIGHQRAVGFSADAYGAIFKKHTL